MHQRAEAEVRCSADRLNGALTVAALEIVK
jgi:hypothetical protein